MQESWNSSFSPYRLGRIRAQRAVAVHSLSFLSASMGSLIGLRGNLYNTFIGGRGRRAEKDKKFDGLPDDSAVIGLSSLRAGAWVSLSAEGKGGLRWRG